MFILIVGLNVNHSSMICQVIYFGKIYGRGGGGLRPLLLLLSTFICIFYIGAQGLLLSLRVSICFYRTGDDLELFTTMKLV